ncbi:hypothetical protein TNCV_1496641 [Trichonephila clavipes]|nr:hypothetical protein TNCV_1496641 [Trichonephila clavipes]
MNLLAFRNRTLVPPPRSPFRVRLSRKQDEIPIVAEERSQLTHALRCPWPSCYGRELVDGGFSVKMWARVLVPLKTPHRGRGIEGRENEQNSVTENVRAALKSQVLEPKLNLTKETYLRRVRLSFLLNFVPPCDAGVAGVASPKDAFIFRNDLLSIPPHNGRIDERISVYSYQTHIKYLSLNQIARHNPEIFQTLELWMAEGQNQKLRSSGKPQKSGTDIATLSRDSRNEAEENIPIT